MQPKQSPSWFTLYDFLISIAPGAVLLLAIIGLFPRFSFAVNKNLLPIGSILFFIVSFIIGEFINIGMSKFYFTPISFRKTLNEVHPNNVETKWDKRFEKFPSIFPDRYTVTSKTREEFWNLFKQEFGTSDNFDEAQEIYLLVLNDMENKMGDHTKRCRRMSKFCLNMMGSFAFITILYILFLLNPPPISPLLPPWAYLGVPIISLSLTGYMSYGHDVFEERYTFLLFLEFYAEYSRGSEKDSMKKELA